MVPNPLLTLIYVPEVGNWLLLIVDVVELDVITIDENVDIATQFNNIS